jgi:hypothetical protein
MLAGSRCVSSVRSGRRAAAECARAVPRVSSPVWVAQVHASRVRRRTTARRARSAFALMGRTSALAASQAAWHVRTDSTASQASTLSAQVALRVQTARGRRVQRDGTLKRRDKACVPNARLDRIVPVGGGLRVHRGLTRMSAGRVCARLVLPARFVQMGRPVCATMVGLPPARDSRSVCRVPSGSFASTGPLACARMDGIRMRARRALARSASLVGSAQLECGNRAPRASISPALASEGVWRAHRGRIVSMVWRGCAMLGSTRS